MGSQPMQTPLNAEPVEIGLCHANGSGLMTKRSEREQRRRPVHGGQAGGHLKYLVGLQEPPPGERESRLRPKGRLSTAQLSPEPFNMGQLASTSSTWDFSGHVCDPECLPRADDPAATHLVESVARLTSREFSACTDVPSDRRSQRCLVNQHGWHMLEG